MEKTHHLINKSTPVEGGWDQMRDKMPSHMGGGFQSTEMLMTWLSKFKCFSNLFLYLLSSILFVYVLSCIMFISL